MRIRIFLSIGALLFSANAMAVDQAQIAGQVRKALAASPLTPEQKVQHALSRIGFGPNAAANGIGVKTFLRYRTDSLGQKFVDAAATDQAIANWVAANIAYVGSIEPEAEEQIQNFPITVASPLGSFVMKPTTSVAEQANFWFNVLEYRSKQTDPDKYHEASVTLTRIGSASIQFEAQRTMSRAILARYPLGEALHNFWFNHFNVMAMNVQGHVQQFRGYKNGIRKYQAADFASLLSFTANHPTMLIYLDNYKNVRPVSATRGINENYAREVIELHTLGEGPNLGNYVQSDVFQAARILTGLTIKGQTRLNPTYTYFCATCHDPGTKTVMGRKFAEGQSGQAAFLKFIALHPRTAKNIAHKLVNRFAIEQDASNAGSEAARISLENRVAKAFGAYSGNLMQVYVSLFTAPEFWGASAFQAKVKQPFEWVASAYRMAGVGSEAPLSQAVLNTAIAQVRAMGQPIHEYSFPTGYKDANSMWANTNGINLAASYGLNAAQLNQTSFVAKSGALLKGAALENYFNVRNAIVPGPSFQDEYGRRSTPVCTNGMLLPESDPNFKLFCFYRYLPYEQIVDLARASVATKVLDFEGVYPTSYAAQNLLLAAMTGNADKIKNIPQPVKTQLALLMANPKFLRR